MYLLWEGFTALFLSNNYKTVIPQDNRKGTIKISPPKAQKIRMELLISLQKKKFIGGIFTMQIIGQDTIQATLYFMRANNDIKI